MNIRGYPHETNHVIPGIHLPLLENEPGFALIPGQTFMDPFKQFT